MKEPNYSERDFQREQIQIEEENRMKEKAEKEEEKNYEEIARTINKIT